MINNHEFNNTDEEFGQIKEFLTRVQGLPDYDDNWDVGRMNWWRYSYHAQKDVSFFRKNAHYWVDDMGNVIGLCISEYGKDDFFALSDPKYPNLLEVILAWTESVWAKEKDSIKTFVFTYDKEKVNTLIKKGYENVRKENNVRYYDLTNYDFSYNLNPEFKIITFNKFGDYDSRIALIKNAFNIKEYPKERLVALQSSPQYIPELDLVAVNLENKAVAYCMGWVEEHDVSQGYVEPMGTHSDYRRMGLASSMVKECFKRLSRLGVKTASIASDAEPNVSNYLYESLMPFKKKIGFEFRKSLNNK